jgi:hypothetical protein
MKSSEPQAPIDRILAQPQPTELKPPHHPILPLSDLRNPPIPRPSLRWPANIAG